ncbi:metal dependent phosphohydrolase [Clostridium sp. CAG:307]|nr:metal dependent phosphohydrolase [Clostridium sp. CAG:307]
MHKITNYKKEFSSNKVEALALYNNEQFSFEYYHLFKEHSLHINLDGEEEIKLLYFLLKGKCEFYLDNERIVLDPFELLEINTTSGFNIYALEEISLLYISLSDSKINLKTDELSKQIERLENKDDYLKGHNYRVSKYALIILEEMGLKLNTDNLNYAASYHDIGKIKISPDIVHKESSLTPKEFEVMKMHPIYSYEIIKPILGEDIAYIAKCHHEKLDGSGYPLHLKGDAIPIEAQIIAVADIFDALTTKRTYRDAYSFNDAIKIMEADVINHKINKEAYNALKKAINDDLIKLN